MVLIGYITTMTKKNARAGLRPTRPSAAERLMTTASELFYRMGIRAIGVDQIVRDAGVAKVSLYRAYPSKDDLIVRYLRERDADFWRAWDAAVGSAKDAGDGLQAVLAFIATAIGAPEYRGCPFANFVAEFPDEQHDGRAVVEASKHELRLRLGSLCRDLEMHQPERLADGLFLLVEGAISASQTAKSDEWSTTDAFRCAADSLIASHSQHVGRSSSGTGEGLDRNV
jgi:AcrR family transcriptional regulator